MRFNALNQLSLRCRYEQFIPGALHADGRRYLPQIVVTPLAAGPNTAPSTRLWLVDRHHRADPTMAGQNVIVRLLCALSVIQLQTSPFRAGFAPPPNVAPETPLSEPIVYGRVADVLTWEVQREHLPFETLYTELVISLSDEATIGLRTTLSAPRIADLIGCERLMTGHWIEARRSRIDILMMEADTVTA
ncbi:hypothetical protein [Chloroflexus sp.]|uniref:hypothetical protein n=1 Tax=Chloroflexus sp. TaxID=1904827 RepID=UPI00260DED06|nr:hypothetical protein [uncultured Chloroflexus sp.]